ncbi:MAG TPA: AraC family transcriptional regulator [Pyrinomonadaceae bacterium]
MSAKREHITVWRPADFSGIEMRSGISVAEPYPRHWHEEYQFCFIQAGGGELFYRGAAHATPRESLFIVHPGEVHSNQTDVGCSFHSIYVHPELIRRLLLKLTDRKQCLPFFPDPMILDQDICADYKSLYAALANDETHLQTETIMLALLNKLVGRHAQDPFELTARRIEQVAVKKVREYIFDNHARNIRLKELARYADVSPFHLNHAFTRQIGMPPHAFQIQVRIANAKKLLRNGLSPASVASTTGFADQSHFIRHFKRLTKITPGDYVKTARTFNTKLNT